MEPVDIAWGGRREWPPLPREAQFAAALEEQCPGLDYWLHRDDRGEWLLVSWDFVEYGSVCATLRLDFDDEGFRGGWSPAMLNWDDGVRAEEAAIDLEGPDGTREPARGRSPAELAVVAAAWFDDHREQWPGRQAHHRALRKAMPLPAPGVGRPAPAPRNAGRAWTRAWSATVARATGRKRSR